MTISNLKPWKPGQSGNPSGRQKLPEELRAIKALSPTEVCRIVSKYARMTRIELQKSIDNPDIPMIDLTICSIFAQSAKNGDYQRLAFLLDRAIGKVKEMEHDENDREELQKLSLNELLALVKDNLPEVG